ncbi:MAG: phenylalanine--tRNA ligase subunit beta [Methylobacillus sp.]|jgi:phenylalanyl-tRNA synthetase beta chain|nr:phenylalanine--tRNA ligase subunit beta [Methylobacillus sp.]
MKFSEQWLRSMANPPLSSEALSHLLTMAGLEVEECDPVAPAFNSVVIAEIVAAEKHPDADRLQILRVNVGAGEPLQIVCGAPNARVGLKAPCALVGANLPDFEIKHAKVRGVESLGMMCSAKELGLSEESGGLLELSADAPVGRDIRDWLNLNDQLFTLKLTPNRCDCLSIQGIAREVAALTGIEMKAPEIVPVAAAHEEKRNVRVMDAHACPRYAGRIMRGVNVKAATPEWMKQRLERSGVRSISAIVDVTNYVLLELGQPMHAFDLDKLHGDIQVRMAKPAEKLELLNQQEVELQADDLVITDDSGVIALAGIMGGTSTAVTDATTNIFLESAFFSPAAIVGKVRRLNFSTESSYRFERGVDFAATVQVLERATQLILEICGGSAGPVNEVEAELPPRPAVRLRLERVQRVLGIAFSRTELADFLQRLRMPFTHQEDEFLVVPPTWRFDIRIEEDLIEEIARLYGYENIQPALPLAKVAMLADDEARSHPAYLRAQLVAADYQEVVTYSFVDQTWECNLAGNDHAIPLRNPIASNMSVMRSTLWGGLLEAVIYNLNRKQERVRLFEIGACFSGKDYGQRTKIAGICTGAALHEQWGEAARNVDFYDIKADVEMLTRSHARFVADRHPALHPGQSARIELANGQTIGWMGGLHPKWQQHYQLPSGAVLFELDLAPLLEMGVPHFTEVAKFPPVRRDLAVLVAEAVSAQALIDTMNEAGVDVMHEIALFDQYRGKGVPEGMKGLAFFVVMQDTQRTLTDEEADAAMARLLAAIIQKHGAVLRS